MPFWKQLDRPLVLASQSPRRRDILGRMGLAFTVVAPAVADEQSLLQPAQLAASLSGLAERKARSTSAQRRQALVLGADTVVVAGDEVLGKPRDAGDARRMLGLLAGRSHEVWSGVALVCEETGFCATGTARTLVRFRSLPASEIEQYLSAASWADKAGAYGIQDAAMAFVESIEGCYYNVMGLPVVATIRLFELYQSRGTAHE